LNLIALPSKFPASVDINNLTFENGPWSPSTKGVFWYLPRNFRSVTFEMTATQTFSSFLGNTKGICLC